MGSRRLVRSEEVLWRRTARDVVALALDGEDPVVLSGAGLLLWELLEEPVQADELYGVLADVHGIALEVVLEEAEPVVEELIRLGIVQVRS